MRSTSGYTQQIIGPIIKKISTNVDSPLELDSINDDDPTITIPRIAIPQPTKCLFSNTIFINILENIAVVTIDAPLNIIYVDPEIKLKPIYCSIDEQESAIAGIKKIHGLCALLPSYKAVGLEFLVMKKNIKHKDSPMNIEKACM